VPVPILTGENWTINRSAEMRFLLPVAGYTLPDQKRNTDIRLELKTFDLIERIDRQK
jgi:hypothetical protein